MVFLWTITFLIWGQTQAQTEGFIFPTKCEVGQPAVADTSQQVLGSVQDNYGVTVRNTNTTTTTTTTTTTGGNTFNLMTGQTYDIEITAPTMDLNFMGYAIILGAAVGQGAAGLLLPTSTTSSGQPFPGGLCPSNLQSLTNTTTSTATQQQQQLETIQIQIQLLDTLPNATIVTLDVTLVLLKEEETNSGGNSSTTTAITTYAYYYSQFNLLAISGNGSPTTSTTTSAPSAIPSYTPSLAPSAVPSSAPSVTASTAPTAIPSITPSAIPSLAPSASPTAAPIPASSVYGYIASSPNHQQWANAISKSNLGSRFSSNSTSPGSQSSGYTLFVPTDESINQWGRLDKLLDNAEEWRYHLADLVLFHTLAGSWTNDRLLQQTSSTPLPSLNGMGEGITISSVGNAITLNGEATLRNDETIFATNGIVQAVDGVMTPVSQKGTVYEFVILGSGAVINIERELTTLASLFTKPGLQNVFQIWGEGPFTLFAPTDEAFAQMSQDELNYLTTTGNEDLLVSILNYHVAPGIHASADLQALASSGSGTGSLAMANGKNTMVSASANETLSSYTIDSANPIRSDILLNNGMVHLIDAVMIPRVTADDLVCPEPPPNSGCTPSVSQVICGHFVNCTFDNECLANAAGFQECRTPPPTIAPTMAPTVTPATSVWEIIETNEELDQFQLLLQEVNINLLLVDSNEVFTVIAPLNQAIQGNTQIPFYQANINNWSIHLTRLLEEHIIRGSLLTEDQLFNSSVGVLTSAAGGLVPIDTNSRLVGGHQITEADLLALNGVAHVLDGVLGSTHLLTLVQLLERGLDDPTSTTQRRLQTSAFAKLLGLLQSTSLINDRSLTQRSLGGTTLIAPVDISENILSSDKGTANELLLYHILENTNLYATNLQPGTQVVLDTRHPTAQVLVTVDQQSVLRLNDLAATQEILGQNGVLQVVNNALKPPYVTEVVHYFQNHTSLSVRLMDDFLQASGWATNVDIFVGNGADGRLTLLAPIDDAFNQEIQGRLTQPSWSLHLRDLLKNLLLPNVFTQTELQDLAETQSLAGTTVSVGSISTSMQATNGVVHLVDAFDAPQSMSLNVLDLIIKNNTFLLAPIDIAGLSDTLSKQSPVTFFAPPENSFQSVPPTDFRDVLENHIFLDMMYAEELVNMDGQVINSMNNKVWVVEVLGESVFLKAKKDDVVVIPVKIQGPVDALGVNGVVHNIDGLLTDEAASEAPSMSPTGIPQPTLSPSLPPNVATIDVTFLVYNTEGLTTTAVSQSVGIDEAFVGFVEALVGDVEGILRQRRLQSIMESRQLLATLRTNSAIIESVRAQLCPTNIQPAIPGNALCHLVSGRFYLDVLDETIANVQERYRIESVKAIGEGKLQEILETKDPNSPFVVVQAQADTFNPTTVPSNSNQTAPTILPTTGSGPSQAPVNTFAPSLPTRGGSLNVTGQPSSTTVSPSANGTGSPTQAVLPSNPTITPSVNETGPTRAPNMPSSPTSTPSLNATTPTQAPVLPSSPTSNPSVNETSPTLAPVLPITPTSTPSAIATTQAPFLPSGPTSSPSFGATAPTHTPGVPSGPTSAPSMIATGTTQAPSLPSGPTSTPSVSAAGPTQTPTQAPVLTKTPTTQPTNGSTTQPPFLTSNPTAAPVGSTISPSLNDRPTPAPALTSGPTTAPSIGAAAPTRVPVMTLSPTGNGPTLAPSSITLAPTSGQSIPLTPTANPTTISPPTTLQPTAGNVTDPNPTSAPISAVPAPTASPTGTPTLVQINTTFLMFNAEGLTSEDLTTPERVLILNQAWIDFCENLVNDVEGNSTLTQRYLRASPRGRRLEVTLHPRSSAVYGVRDVVCPSNHQPPIPDNATCVETYGKYALSVTDDEDPEAVQEKYVDETEKALADGKMQESLNRTDPDYPFIVFGPVDTGTTPPEPTEPPTEEDEKMEWWLILLIVFFCLLGLCWIGMAIAFFYLRQKQTATETSDQASKLEEKDDATQDEAEGEPGSVHPMSSAISVPNTIIADYTHYEKETVRNQADEEDDKFEDEDGFETESDDSSHKEDSLVLGEEEEETRVDQSTVVNIESEEMDSDDRNPRDWQDEDDTDTEEEQEWEAEDEDEDEYSNEENQVPLSPSYVMPSTIVQDPSMIEDATISSRSTRSVDAPSFWDDTGSDSRTRKSEWIGDDATAQIAESFADAGHEEFFGSLASSHERSEVSTIDENPTKKEPEQHFVPTVEEASSSQESSVPSVPVACDASQEDADDAPMISKFGDAPSTRKSAAAGIEEVGNLRDPSLCPGDDPSVAHSITSIAYVRRDPSLYPGDDPSAAVSLMSYSVSPPLRDPSLYPGDDPTALNNGSLLRDPSLYPGDEPSAFMAASTNGSLLRDPSLHPGDDPSARLMMAASISDPLLRDPSLCPADDPSAIGPTMTAAYIGDPLLRDPSLYPADDPSAVGPNMMRASLGGPLLRDPSTCAGGGNDPSVAGSLYRDDPSIRMAGDASHQQTSESLLEELQEDEATTHSSKITSGPAVSVVSSLGPYAADDDYDGTTATPQGEENSSSRAAMSSVGESVATVFNEEMGEAVETVTTVSTPDPPLTTPTDVEDLCNSEEEIDVFCLSSSEDDNISQLTGVRLEPVSSAGFHHNESPIHHHAVSDDEKKEVESTRTPPPPPPPPPLQARRVSMDPISSGAAAAQLDHGSLGTARGEMDRSESEGGWEDHISSSSSSRTASTTKKNKSERRTSRRKSRRESKKKRGFLSSSSSSSSSIGNEASPNDSATNSSSNLEGEVLVEEAETTSQEGNTIGRISEHSGDGMMSSSVSNQLKDESEHWMIEDLSFHFENQRRATPPEDP